MFCSKIGFWRTENLLNSGCGKVVGKRSSPLSSDLKTVLNVLVVVDVTSLIMCNATSTCRGARFQSGAWARCLCPLRLRKDGPPRDSDAAPCICAYRQGILMPRSGTYVIVKHCLFNNARANRGCPAISWFNFCRGFAPSCVLQILQTPTRCRICFIRRSLEKCKPWPVESSERFYYCSQWNEEGFKN